MSPGYDVEAWFVVDMLNMPGACWHLFNSLFVHHAFAPSFYLCSATSPFEKYYNNVNVMCKHLLL